MNSQEQADFCTLARHHLNLTQAQLADLLQVHVMTISRWERNVLLMDHAQLVVLRALYDGRLTIEEVKGCEGAIIKLLPKLRCNVTASTAVSEHDAKTLENKG